ncbi:sigma-70 family RNA polymerase sigma factor, partial [Candidatus Poribacteria bacterium]|nr:sigma-70 family RNA polymerase sigma factor [Candidatus Poribacteria bacterium]
MKNSDTQLIQRVLNGDETAFSELVKKYQRQVHALAWRKIGDFHIAEEITQDTFLNAYQKLRTLKKPQRFASWLYVIATNRCNTWLHKKHFRAQLLKNKGGVRPEKPSYAEYALEENERISVETQREVVKKLLAKLEESERTVMTLHYFAEMSCTEIGAFLGVSANTIKSRLRRAQQRLKKEEPMIREALENFQISPNLTEIIMREIARVKPDAPFSSKPLVPWAVAASTLAVMLLVLGFGNQQYFARFQKPYSFDATSEMTVEIIDTPIIANLESKIDVRTQIGRTNAVGKRHTPEQQPNDAPAAITEAQTEETVKDWTQWELPEKAKARLGKGGINVLQFSPDGTQLAVGSNIGVWLYDVETEKEISMFPGMCQSLAFSPDGRFLAHGGNQYRGEALQLWEVATRRKVALPALQFSAAVLQFSEDSKTLISLENHGLSINHLDIDTRKGNVKKIKDQSSNFSPAPDALTDDKFAVGRKDGRIELWDTITGEKLLTLSGHADHSGERDFPEECVLALAFSPDGTQLASGGGDTTVRLWNATSNDEPTILHQHHEGWVNVLAFSPDGKMLASGSTDKTVLLSDTTTGKLLAALTGRINGITALTFSPDGSMLASASADGTVQFWDVKTGKSLATRINGHSQWIKAVTFLRENSTLVSAASNGIITFWDLKTPQNPTLQMGEHRDWFKSLVFSPDGTRLASVGVKRANMIFKGSAVLTSLTFDNLIRLTDTRTGHEVTVKETHSPSNPTFSPDGKMLAFNSSDKIHLWHTETGYTLDIPFFDPNDHPELSYHPEISALAFSPVKKELVSATDTGKVQVWDTE